MRKKWIAAVLCIVLVAAVGCGSGSSSGAEDGSEDTDGVVAEESAAQESTETAAKTYTKAEHEAGKYYIGILQQADHGSLNEAANGFQDEIELLMGSDVVCDYQVADGTQESMQDIAEQFVTDEDDLIVAEGTLALQAAGEATEDIPIVGAAVTDFIIAGGVSSVDEPGGNITGISDLPPIQSQAQAVEALVSQGDQIGIVYCSDEPNSEFQARLLETYLDDDSFSWKEYRFSSESELQSTVESACEECGVLYLPADNALAQHMDVVREVSVDHKTRVFTSDKAMCEAGGLVTLSVDYYVLGQRCADEAYNIIRYNADDSSSSGSTSSSAGSTETKEEIAAREEAEADAEEEGNISKIAIDRVRDTMAGWYNPEVAEAIGYTPYGDYTAIEMENSDPGSTGSTGTAVEGGSQ